MNKTEFVAALARHGEMTKVEAEKVYNVFRHTLETELADAGKIALVGFGTFEIVERSARKGRNPATGQVVDIPAKKSIRFKAGKEFAETVHR